MHRRALTTLALVALLAAQAEAQQGSAGSARYLSTSARAEMAGEGDVGAAAGGLFRRSLHVVAGALVGAGIGYFTSQVVYSDWEKTSNSTFLDQRRLYSLTGAGVGAITGLLVGGRQPAVVGPVGLSAAEGPADRAMLTRQEITRSSATNAYQAVQSLRPSWFITRGMKHSTEQGWVAGDDRNAVTLPGMPQIVVYFDQANIGGVDALQRIQLPEIGFIERLSAPEATQRFGSGHSHGAIVVHSVAAEN